jgi:DNA-binding beta-propeller fold protein YncE
LLDTTSDSAWSRLPAGLTFEEVPGVTVDDNGHVFVFHRGPRPIMEFDAAGACVRAWGDGTYVRPHAVRIDREGNLWAVDDGGHFVVRMDSDGRVNLVLGRKNMPGETAEAFNRPTDVGFGPNGDIFVTDGYGNSRVVRFDREGRFVTAWGTRGVGAGEFNQPHAIIVDDAARVYVADRENSRIQLFNAEGGFIAQWRHLGSPWGLALTPAGEIFMCDGYANRVVQLTLEGRVTGTFGRPGRMNGQLNFAHHLAVGPDGSV